MGFKSLKVLLSILFVSSVVLSLLVSVVVGKPVGPNPGNPWPTLPIWGTNLRFENSDNIPPSVSEIFWGIGGVSDSTTLSAPDPPAGIIVEFLAPDYDVSGTTYGTWTKAAVAEPASYTWQVQFRKVKAPDPNGGTVSSTMENIDTRFVPQDYSVVLENTDLGIKINFRANPLGLSFPPFTGGDNVKGTNIRLTPILAALNVDNAVNIESIDNLDPLVGNPGDTLRLRVFVKNTGRYTDNYVVSSLENGILDPTTITNLAPDSIDNVILTTTYPNGVENIVVTAAGNYATDQSYITVTGIRYSVEVSISPENLIGLRGQTLAYAVTVWNRGTVENSFKLENHDNLGWQLALDTIRFDNVLPGENRTTTLHVTIPDNAIPGTQDNIRVKAAYEPDNSVSAENICTARLALVTFTVSISPNFQGKIRGGSLTYTVTIGNTTTDNLDFKDNYNLTISGDNSSWSLSPLPDNRIENVGRGGENSENFTVTIPIDALLYAVDDITVIATSQADNNVSENASCVAQAKYRVSVSISPSFKEGARGDNLTYTITVQNWGDNIDNYILTENDNVNPSWAPMLDDQSFVNVQPGESRTTVLRVPVSWYSPPGTLDNIKVRANLAEDENISVENNCSAYSILLVKQVYQTDDAFVSENAPDNNYGGDFLYVGRISNLPVRSFLKLDLSVIPGGSTIENASLNLTTRVFDGTAGGVFGGGENVQCRPVDNENWSEGTITWNNASWTSIGNILDAKSVTQDFTLYSWEVTNFVTGEFGGNNEVSFSMVGAGENTAPDHWARFYSKESGPSVSYLSISYAPGPHSMAVSISPNQIIGRDNVSYSVTVQNVGFENSSYLLENMDALGFPLRLDNTQFDNIPPGENRITTLRVTIDNSLTTGTRDEITVKATSIEDNNVIGSAKCFAQAARRGANVTVSVPAPTERGAKPGENLVFSDITVSNIDNFADSYILSLSDNVGWGPTISPTTLTIAGETSENVTLTVLIPDNSATGMRDSIQITATSLTDNTVSAESSCVAKTTNFFRRVTVSIAPSHQENSPGENLTFIVTVTNTGNVRDNFLLTASDNKNWGLSLSAPWVGWIENGASENVLLKVRISDNALESTIDNIKVKATSAENENVYSESSCSVTALKAAGRVAVTISPSERTGVPGEKLSFTVTLNNTGGVDDNYNLTVSDDAGWGATLSASTAAISAGGSHNVTASVTVPTDAVKGESTVITVTALGTGYENSASCTAIAGAKVGGGILKILIIVVVAVLIAIGVAIAVLLKKGIIGLHHSASK